MRFAVVIVLALLALSCRSKPKAAPNVTRTEFHWPGTGAEELAEVVRSIAPGFSVAIVHDERAEVFHEMSEREVDYELGLTAAQRPDRNFAISGPHSLSGGIPALPSTTPVPSIAFEFDQERIAALGLTAHDVQQAVIEAGIKPEADPESAERLDTLHVTNSAGDQLRLVDVANLTQEFRERPLIIDRR